MAPTATRETTTGLDRVVSVAEAASIVGCHEVTLYRWERSGIFPSRRRIGQAAVGYLASDLANWMKSRPKVNEAANGGAS